MKLSPNFTLDELTFSETAARQDIDNAPSPGVIENLKLVAATLEQIRELVGRPITVSSGYRSLALNKAVGGSGNSAHTFGLAADINCPGVKPGALAHIIKASNIEFDQLILEFDRWVHIGLVAGKPRGELLTIRTGTGYMKGIV
jgi:zinc D-Ala-D-Ala carboxypeptidase